ncbi:MAG: branched-chain amino acid ABC transporter permease [Magnetovibrio sp.]|nr:branched-chain amino acid ABC transporter permease [Magnetovibrio sp.]
MDTSKDMLIGLVAIVLGSIFTITFIAIESETGIIGLIALSGAAVVLASRTGISERISNAFSSNESMMNSAVLVAVLVIIFWFREDHFSLLMIATVMLYLTACLGLNIQLGYTGVVNFSGAAFFGIGCYTAAVLNQNTGLSPLIVLVIGGIMAALIGSILILPMLRTRGHYAAVVTIAFAILFKTFLEVNDTLGGAQGLKVPGMEILGWDFNSNIEIGDEIELSFYLNYVAIALVLSVLAFILMRRVERSWIGLNLDAVRLDETVAACFGISIKRWKVTAFTMGNFLIGMSGAVFAMMLGFIAPSNFAFSDSLMLLSIVLLGGMGSPWGTVVAAGLVILLPEKLQVIQEYRFLLFAVVVILILVFKPQGLLPRGLRAYIPGWRG